MLPNLTCFELNVEGMTVAGRCAPCDTDWLCSVMLALQLFLHNLERLSRVSMVTYLVSIAIALSTRAEAIQAPAPTHLRRDKKCVCVCVWEEEGVDGISFLHLLPLFLLRCPQEINDFEL